MRLLRLEFDAGGKAALLPKRPRQASELKYESGGTTRCRRNLLMECGLRRCSGGFMQLLKNWCDGFETWPEPGAMAASRPPAAGGDKLYDLGT